MIDVEGLYRYVYEKLSTDSEGMSHQLALTLGA